MKVQQEEIVTNAESWWRNKFYHLTVGRHGHDISHWYMYQSFYSTEEAASSTEQETYSHVSLDRNDISCIL